MNRLNQYDIPPRPRFHSGLIEVGVHVLSEYVFCERAAILALKMGQDSGEDGRNQEQRNGPRLHGLFDYDVHRFAEEIQAAWIRVRNWVTIVGAAMILAFGFWRLWSPMAGLVGTLPFFLSLARLWEVSTQLVDLIREQSIFRNAPPWNIDLAPTRIQKVDWWSLRKAGFDCLMPADSFRDPELRLVGKPWRMLVKGTSLRIPVIRKHLGEANWGPQHRIRISAYCRLIETCQGGESPFGILVFADSYDCLIIPNTIEEQGKFEEALYKAREFLRSYSVSPTAPMWPTDNRCRGCHLGKPREVVRGASETVLVGVPVQPFVKKGADGAFYHCSCGDLFERTPPHEDAIKLRIV